MTPVNTSRRTPEQWLALVERQRDSGLNMAEFARREQLVYQSFVSWCRKARERHDMPRDHSLETERPVAARSEPASPPRFVELTLPSATDAQPSPRATTAPAAAPDTDWLVELDLGGGVTLRVRRPL